MESERINLSGRKHSLDLQNSANPASVRLFPLFWKLSAICQYRILGLGTCAVYGKVTMLP